MEVCMEMRWLSGLVLGPAPCRTGKETPLISATAGGWGGQVHGQTSPGKMVGQPPVSRPDFNSAIPSQLALHRPLRAASVILLVYL